MSHSHSSDTSSAEGIDGAAIAISPSLVGVVTGAGLHALIVQSWAHPGRVQFPLPSHFPHSHVACTWPRTTLLSDADSTWRTFDSGFLEAVSVGASSSNQTFLAGEFDLELLKADFAWVKASKRVHSQATEGLITECESGRAVQSTARSNGSHLPSRHAHVDRLGHSSPEKRGVGVRKAWASRAQSTGRSFPSSHHPG